MTIRGGVAGTTVLTVLSIALTACGGSDSKVSVDKLQKAADKAMAAPANPCPLGFDVNAGLKKAKVAVTAAPVTSATGARFNTRAVDADSATTAGDGTPFKQLGGAEITCFYTLSGGGSLEAVVAGVHKDRAIDLIAARLVRDGNIASNDLRMFITQNLTVGKGVLTPGGGLAAITKLDASGGDVLLEVTTRADDRQADHGPLVGEPLRELTEALGKQVRV